MKKFSLFVLFFCFSISYAQVPSYVEQIALKRYFSFSNTTNDLSSLSQHLTNFGATFTSDRIGNTNKAINLDSGQYLESYDNGLPIMNQPRTISFWINTNYNINNDVQLFTFCGYSPSNTLSVKIKQGYLAVGELNLEHISQLSIGGPIWQNVTIVIDSNNTTVYNNGNYVDSLLNNVSVYNGYFRIGSPSSNNSNIQLDDIAIWSGVLSYSNIVSLYSNCTPPSAPHGNTTQTFCINPSPTVASLTATGTAIQWYAAPTGGTPLASTTALLDGATYYASQTVNDCESTTRLAVVVNFNDPQISASSTTVCSGTAVNIGITNINQTLTQFQAANTDLILFNTIGNHYYFYKNLPLTWQQAKAYGDQIGVSMYVINDAVEELSVYNSLPFRGNDGKQYWIGLYQDLTSPNYSEPSGGWKWVDNTPLTYTNWYSMEPNNAINGEIFAQIDWDIFGIRWNDAGNSANNNGCACDLAFPIYEFQIQSNYLWSTGATTPAINPTPTTTTTYWCDVTVNGVTCRKEITINVNSTTPAPTGNTTQVFCVTPAPTVASLIATGTAVQWYAAPTGGSPLASTTTLVDGTTYYASQTVNGCESTTRFAVTVDFNDPQITASATTVCSGTAVTLTASTTATPTTNNCTLPTNLQNGLVGYWPFCGNANDVSGNNNNGTVNGATLTTDRFGNANSAYSFDGINDYIIVPHNQSINFNTNNNYSISTWVKFINLLSDSNIVEKWEADTPYPYSLRASNNRIYVYRYLSGGAPYDNSEVNGANYNGTINYNQFYNIFVEFEPNSLKLYINGQLQTTSANMLPSNLVNNLANLYFGGSSPSGIPRYLNGIIDDVHIYNRILSSEEKIQLYNIGQTTYLWSTGATTSSITPSPTSTTTYWCDVTVNGVTCRKEITINVNSTTPAPTGNTTQVFCVTPAPTVASLMATGTAVQWYAAPTGGSPLASTTTLVDGTTYYASQTVNGCESTTRFAVTVDFNDPQITASATTVCSGTAVTLTASTTATPTTNNCTLPTNLQNGLVGYWPFCGNANDVSGNNNNGTVNGATLTTDRFGNANSAYSFDGINDYIISPSNGIPSSGVFTVSFWIKMNAFFNQLNDNVEFIALGSPANTKWGIASNIQGAGRMNYGKGCLDTGGNSLNSLFVLNSWNHYVFRTNNTQTEIFKNGILVGTTLNGSSGTCTTNNLYFGTDIFSNQENTNMLLDDVMIWNSSKTDLEINQLYNNDQTTYLWSTGETTATINPAPTIPTTYWCDVTVNGVTCRKEITINVNSTTPAPTGNTTQVFCVTPAPTVASLMATGTAVQWYAAPTGGLPLASTTTLVDGTTYYASQTVNGCESTTRFAVTVDFNDPQITASATTVCSGTAVTLTASTTATPTTNNCTLPTNLQNGLVGYWPFCGNANDESGNGNNGTVNGATLTTDRFGNANSAYSFDGNDYIALQQPFFNGSTNVSSFTYSMWFIINQYPSNNYTLSGKEGFWRTISLSIDNNGIVNFGGSQPSPQSYFGVASTNAVPLNQWNHIIVTFQNGVLKLYINGTFSSMTTITYSSLNYSYLQAGNSTSTNYFGAINPVSPGITNYLNGKIDDFSIWNRALTQAEISQLYSSTTYLWSTGETTSTINPTPTATTTYWCDVTVNGVTCRKEFTITVNPNITPTFTQVAAICSGTTLTALPTTSNNGITGTWSPALNNTATTTYSFTPTAGQCATTATMTITVNPNILPTFTQVAAICSGATLTALPITSNNGIAGTWSPTLNNTATTTYTFAPTTGQCATVATMTITVNPNITPTFTQVAAICSSAALTALPTTSNNGITGTWSPTLNNTATTTYTFTPTAGQCASTVTMTIDVNPLPTVPTGQTSQEFCLSDAPRLSDIVTNGSNIVWYTSSTILTPLTQNVFLQDGITYYAGAIDPITGCRSATRLAVTVQLNNPNTPNLATNQIFCEESNPTIASLNTGNNIVYYNAAINGIPYTSTDELYDGMMLYAAQIDTQTGCESALRLLIQIELIGCELKIYNLITIDDNVANDRLIISNIENFPDNSIQIFNRYGSLVWSTVKYNNVDNTFTGKAREGNIVNKEAYLPTGTYFYVLRYYSSFERKEKEMKGFIQIDNKK